MPARVDGHAPITLREGDFVLLPATPGFTLSSFAPAPPVFIDPKQAPGGQGERRHGEPEGAPDMRSLGGAFMFDRADPGLAGLPMVEQALAGCRAFGLRPGLFSAIKGNPTGQNVGDGVAAFKADATTG